jgi:endonuclease/exonuclease/phosphatase family metal-dependent hydrolase
MPPVPSGPDTRLLITPPLAACDPAATAPARVRVASWNMDAALTGSLADLGDVLAAIDADVVLLQEVDDGTQRSGGVNQPEVLGARLHEAYAFAESIPWQGGHYGLATLSRLPFAAARRIALDTPDDSERRIGFDVTLCFGPTAVHVVNLHADTVPSAGAQNAIDLLSALRSEIGGGLMLAGDFNAAPSDPGPQAALAAGLVDVVVGYDPSPTWNDRRQDLIFADGKIAPHATAAHVVASDKSDHRPLYVDLTY